jgi:hypothetical protein
MKIFPGMALKSRLPRASASLILLLLMLPIKSVAFVCLKGGTLMKRALIGGLSILAMIVGIQAASAQANLNPNIYPVTPGAKPVPWEWHAGPGPNKRGGMCVTHVDLNRGYGFQGPCPAPKTAAAPATKKKAASR